MDGVMSQEEINALLNGSEDSSEQPKEEVLTEKEKDTIGEIANISMGTGSDHAVFSGKPKSRDLDSSCFFRKLE